jgi:hypothetical protein
MDEGEIGAHCAKCGRRDFLPIRCDACHGDFCKDCVTGHACAAESDAAPREEAAESGRAQGGGGTAALSYKDFIVDPRDRDGTRVVPTEGRRYAAERPSGVVVTADSAATARLRSLAASDDPAKRDKARKVLLMKMKGKAVMLDGIKTRFLLVVARASGTMEAVWVDAAWPVVRCVDRLARLWALRNPNADELDDAKRLHLFFGPALLSASAAVSTVVHEGDVVTLSYGLIPTPL